MKLTDNKGNLRPWKIHLIELEDHSFEEVEAYISAAASAIPMEKLLCLAIRVLNS